jgi:hypothetical protein
MEKGIQWAQTTPTTGYISFIYIRNVYAHIYIYAGLEEMLGVYRDMYAKIDMYIYIPL